MIEINLRPGSKRKASRTAGFSLGGPFAKLKQLPTPDRFLAFITAAWVIGPVLLLWLFLGTRSQAAQYTVDIEGAARDSARFADMIAANTLLRARQDSIAQKLEIIQEIDAGRFVWPHIMDEVSRSLPPYIWLTDLRDVSTDANDDPRFTIEGRAGNNFALTKFIQDLEASPFIRAVTLMSTQQVREDDRLIYAFLLEASYEQAPPDVIRTVPIFGATGEVD